jgi:hypothetical protein
MRRATPSQQNIRATTALRGRARRAGFLAASATVAALIIAAPANAAGRPIVTTGAARDVGYNSATLAGTVNPNGANASYYFQYGPTKAYGSQTAIADAGAGTHAVKVATAVTGLLPLTVYHYRTVAVNSTGATLGDDHTLLTTKVPLSLGILASPAPDLYGGPILIQGTLSGTENAQRQVVLQGNEFPFTAGFQDIGNPELTSATGVFEFPLLGKPAATQFRVVTTTNPPISSPVVLENVAVRVSSHIARTKRPGFARIYGTVTPAEDGMKVAMLRITHGHGVLAGGTILRHSSPTISTFSRVVPVKRGLYRVLVQVVGRGQASNYGVPLVIR